MWTEKRSFPWEDVRLLSLDICCSITFSQVISMFNINGQFNLWPKCTESYDQGQKPFRNMFLKVAISNLQYIKKWKWVW